MFGIGFFELMVIAVLGLLVFGPEKLPDAIRTFVYGFTKAKRSWQSTRRELEQELGVDEIRREIHNAQVMQNLEKIKSSTENLLDEPEKITEEVLESSIFNESSEKTEQPENVIHSESSDSAETGSENQKTS